MGKFTVYSYHSDTPELPFNGFILGTQHELEQFSYQLSKVREHSRQWQIIRNSDKVVLAQSTRYNVRNRSDAPLLLEYRAGSFSWMRTYTGHLFMDEVQAQVETCVNNPHPYRQWRITRKADRSVVASSENTDLLGV